MSTPRCILIDPSARAISYRDMPSGVAEVQAVVGSNYFTVGMRLKNGDFLYVDDEAMLRQPAPAAFTVDGCPLMGNAVVVRVDPDTGTDCAPLSTVAALEGAVAWSQP